jgi:hypothetical protein
VFFAVGFLGVEDGEDELVFSSKKGVSIQKVSLPVSWMLKDSMLAKCRVS